MYFLVDISVDVFGLNSQISIASYKHSMSIYKKE